MKIITVPNFFWGMVVNIKIKNCDHIYENLETALIN